ncbi:MAG TPA: hypothetical protein VGM86_05995 [Thermoanaerobaculia bacterium]
MRAPRRSILSRALAAGLVLTAGAGAQSPKTFSGQVDISEREILVSLPANLAKARLHPNDFQVLVDGQPREVARAERVSAPWTVLLYVDRVLAGPATAFSSEVTLADHAKDLTRLGTVEIAVAGPDPHTSLPPTRDSRLVELTLGNLSAAARRERDHAPAGQGGPPSSPPARQQLDKLLANLASRHPAGPRVLFLVADGVDLAPAEVALLDRDTPPASGSPESTATAFLDAGRRLAAQGWVVIPVAVKPGDPGTPMAPRSDLDRVNESASPSQHTNSGPPALSSRQLASNSLAYPGVVALATEPRLAPLRALAEGTAGVVIGYDVQLPALFEELPRRWTIWVAEPKAPADGRLHTLSVRLPGRNAEARAPRWLP